MGKRNPDSYQALYLGQRDEAVARANMAEQNLAHFQRIASKDERNLPWAGMTHKEVADKINWLSRDSAGFMAVVQGARDRLYWLAANLTHQDEIIKRLRAELEKREPGLADQLTADIPQPKRMTPEELMEMHAQHDKEDPLMTQPMHVWAKKLARGEVKPL